MKRPEARCNSRNQAIYETVRRRGGAQDEENMEWKYVIKQIRIEDKDKYPDPHTQYSNEIVDQ
jgi:hypothetical protein